MKNIMIAGTASGVGKTTISLGIMSALSKRGINVAPFKVGPDYIDPKFHKFVTGNPSYNLDSWLLDEDTVKYLFKKNMKDKDVGVIEGVMGLYDGFGVEKDMGSSAHISKILKTPVILVIDGKGISLSSSAIVLGYQMYDKEVEIKGIIINRVSGERHYNILKTVIERDVGIPCLGYLPSNLNISLKSRHLGLIPANEVIDLQEKSDELAKIIEETIDLDEILKVAETNITENNKIDNTINGKKFGLRIGIFEDEAFSFYYQDNIDLMKKIGVEFISISPLKDEVLPLELDGLYIGGGFPEIFTNELEKNISFRQDLLRRLQEGLPAYAECGGLMYLTKSITDLEGKKYDMVGFFETDSLMTKRLQRFGYVEVEYNEKISIRAHEFHRSKIQDNSNIEYVYNVQKKKEGKKNKEWKCGLKKKNVIAGYPHIHFYSNNDFLYNMLDHWEKVKTFV
ncbi:cobyrinate a,c-diamide synthase [Clostridium sp. D2Q-11]|uniref:Cobyrinate a,c-diamide synthase n=1 Tax=Anaeromonas frigoriresistens TaxID=2683708 RepID=A0A942Z963_9FIRM|nr:cobyrinate a,c-diamide synthase [Anaeromonas frigoriresistens]MBS4538565.1 cobyrinate a,c-diamide synthase [Anaeromonas frigoriresistens]